jgi:hypothetical protein
MNGAKKMETDVPQENQAEITKDATDDSEWENRVLCSDGNCIGVIGADGCCKECGKKYEGDVPQMSHSETGDDTVSETVDSETADSSSATTEMPEEISAPVDDTWENRILCSDGNCIGVIGPDGKCKECGKPGK